MTLPSFLNGPRFMVHGAQLGAVGQGNGTCRGQRGSVPRDKGGGGNKEKQKHERKKKRKGETRPRGYSMGKGIRAAWFSACDVRRTGNPDGVVNLLSIGRSVCACGWEGGGEKEASFAVRKEALSARVGWVRLHREARWNPVLAVVNHGPS